jgi:hypothetical protein
MQNRQIRQHQNRRARRAVSRVHDAIAGRRGDSLNARAPAQNVREAA